MVKYSFSNWCTIIGNALLLLTFISVTINVCFGNWLWVSLSLILFIIALGFRVEMGD